jgi:hypothetical protein
MIFSVISITTKTHYIMNSLFYIIAVILIIGWAFGFFVAAAGGLIHILLVIAVIAVIIGLLRRPTAV